MRKKAVILFLFIMLFNTSCTVIMTGEGMMLKKGKARVCQEVRIEEKEPGPPKIPSYRYGDDRYIIEKLSEKVKEQRLYIQKLRQAISEACRQ